MSRVRLAVENMYPVERAGVRGVPYSPGFDPTETGPRHYTLDLSHTAGSGSAAVRPSYMCTVISGIGPLQVGSALGTLLRLVIDAAAAVRAFHPGVFFPLGIQLFVGDTAARVPIRVFNLSTSAPLTVSGGTIDGTDAGEFDLSSTAACAS